MEFKLFKNEDKLVLLRQRPRLADSTPVDQVLNCIPGSTNKVLVL